MTLGAMRAQGIRSVDIFCACGLRASDCVDDLPDDLAIPDLCTMFTCSRCGQQPRLVRPSVPLGMPHGEAPSPVPPKSHGWRKLHGSHLPRWLRFWTWGFSPWRKR
jgi:hypothetical protein